MNTCKFHTREPEGSLWGEWISILEKFIDDGKDRQVYDQTVHAQDVTMKIPVTQPLPGEAKVYRLG